MASRRIPKVEIGWRELLELPDLSTTPIKAKIDTGARTSAIHAFGLKVERVDGVDLARFELHPVQRSASDATMVSLPVHRYRKVRSSDGRSELRPSVYTTARLGEATWPIELTLTSRDAMGFRMLLGRSALRGRFLVNVGRSYMISKNPTPKDGSSE